MSEKEQRNDADTNGDNEGNQAKKASEALIAKRKETLSKKAQEAERVSAEEAARRAAEAVRAEAESKYGIDLSGVEDEELRATIKAALIDGAKMRKAASDLASYGLEQARHAAALEIAVELDMLDDAKEIEASLRGARTPAELELTKREVRLELASESAEPKSEKDENKSPEKGRGEGRRFDGGRGKGANQRAELIKKINAIDPNDPEADKKLTELYDEVQEAQVRHARIN